jgi:hypothetical protein
MINDQRSTINGSIEIRNGMFEKNGASEQAVRPYVVAAAHCATKLKVR